MQVHNFLWIHDTAKSLQRLCCSKCYFEVTVCIENGHRECLNGCSVVWGSFLERVKYYSHFCLPLTFIFFFFLTRIKGSLIFQTALSLHPLLSDTHAHTLSFSLSSFPTLQLNPYSVPLYFFTIHSSTACGSNNLASVSLQIYFC